MPDNKYERLLRWSSHKLKIEDRFITNNCAKTKIPRGAIYACFFGENIGFEKSKLEARPCIVISSNLINYNSGNIVVIPLTSKIKYKKDSRTQLKYEWHYVLKSSKYKLRDDSAVQCEDIRSVSKVRLGNFIDMVDIQDMKEIKKRIKRALQT